MGPHRSGDLRFPELAVRSSSMLHASLQSTSGNQTLCILEPIHIDHGMLNKCVGFRLLVIISYDVVSADIPRLELLANTDRDCITFQLPSWAQKYAHLIGRCHTSLRISVV